MKFYDNDSILDAILDLPSGHQKDYASYLYNRVCDDARTYRDAVVLVDFTTAGFATDDAKHDIGRLVSVLDWEHEYSYDDLEHLFATWLWDLMRRDDD